jgi:hypothetical protein
MNGMWFGGPPDERHVRKRTAQTGEISLLNEIKISLLLYESCNYR